MLLNTWCEACEQTTLLLDFQGRVSEGNLLLAGNCAECGKQREILIRVQREPGT